MKSGLSGIYGDILLNVCCPLGLAISRIKTNSAFHMKMGATTTPKGNVLFAEYGIDGQCPENYQY
jgi:hypothetical protein